MAAGETFFLVQGETSFALAPGEHVIGRTPGADLVFTDDQQVSRRHARVTVANGSVEVEDLGSSNGTWIDNEPVRGRRKLPLGSMLRIGGRELELRTAAPQPSVRASMATSPEIPSARFLSMPVEAAIEGPTLPGDPIAMVQDEATRALDEERVAEARRLIEPVLDLIEVAEGPPEASVLERASVFALRLALLTSNDQYANWVVRASLRSGVLMREPVVALLEQAALECVDLDFELLGQYLSMLRRRAPDFAEGQVELLCARIEEAATRRMSTIPAPPPSRA